jgi:hypothetical protein
MVTIGDVFSVVSVLIGIGVTSWAFLLMCSLLFASRMEIAHQAVVSSSKKCAGLGILVTGGGFFGLTILNVPNPLIKLLGLLMIASYFALAAVGASGVALVAASRLKDQSNALSDYHAFSRASGFLVMSALLPVLGWFLFAPLLLLVSSGAGFKAMLSKQAGLAEVSS